MKKFIFKMLIFILVLNLAFNIGVFIGKLIDYNIYRDITKELAYKWNCDYSYTTFEQFKELVKEYDIYNTEFIKSNMNELGLFERKIILSDMIVKLDNKMILFNSVDYNKYQKWYINFEYKTIKKIYGIK